MISACEKAFSLSDRLHLLIAGNPLDTSKDDICTLLSEHKISDRTTTRLTWITLKEMGLYLDASDVCVLPYINFYAQSGILMQALSHGTPLIVSDNCTLSETVRQAGAGSTFHPNDVDSLASEILKMMASDDKRKWYSTNAQKATQELYDWRIVADKTNETYQHILNKK